MRPSVPRQSCHSVRTGPARGSPPGWATGQSAWSTTRTGNTENYVPTRMGARYDALIWLEHTSALRPVHREPPPREHEFETAPSGL